MSNLITNLDEINIIPYLQKCAKHPQSIKCNADSITQNNDIFKENKSLSHAVSYSI